MPEAEVRFGFGYDVHRFAPGRKLRLGGVTIPHSMGLHGHSDADVLIHAICDAILGAAGMGDIGHHFPDSQRKYKGISSLKLLKEVQRIVKRRKYVVVNVDCTVVLEVPRIAPHSKKMREKIARALAIDVTRVSVKATTNEKIGFVGRQEGCAAFAVASIKQLT